MTEAPIQDDSDAARAQGLQVTPSQRQRELAAVKHGLYVRTPSGVRLRDRRVRRLVRKVWHTLTWLQPSDASAVRAWAEMEILAATAAADLFQHGIVKEGEPRHLLDAYRRVRRDQLAFARELGMTPASRAELGLTVGRGLNVAEEFARLHREPEQEP